MPKSESLCDTPKPKHIIFEHSLFLIDNSSVTVWINECKMVNVKHSLFTVQVMLLCCAMDYIINSDYIVRHKVTNKNMQVELSYKKKNVFWLS